MSTYKDYIKERLRKLREYIALLHGDEIYIATVYGELDAIEQLIDYC